MPNVDGQATETTPVTGVPVMPRVNLMPPEIAEAAKFRRFQLAMGGAVVAAIAVVGLLYTNAHSGVSSAQAQVTAAQQEHQVLQSKVNSLQSVQDVYDEVAAKQAMLTQAMGDEIRWSSYLNDLSLRIPQNVWLTNVAATQAAAQSSTATPTPTTTGAQPPVGTITFQGVAFSHDDVATWLDALAKEKGFVNPYFTQSTESFIGPRKVYNFTSSTDLSDAALSGRYTKPAGS